MTGVGIQAIAGRIEKQDSEWKLNRRGRNTIDFALVAAPAVANAGLKTTSRAVLSNLDASMHLPPSPYSLGGNYRLVDSSLCVAQPFFIHHHAS